MCRVADSWDFAFGSILVAWFFGEGAYVVLESLVGHVGCARAAIEVVGDDLSSAWGWGGWPLLYGQVCMGVASDATDHTPIPV
jgi:hypothetical protein